MKLNIRLLLLACWLSLRIPVRRFRESEIKGTIVLLFVLAFTFFFVYIFSSSFGFSYNDRSGLIEAIGAYAFIWLIAGIVSLFSN
jgi:uncharacterized membrane protein YhaH (DUF805 family)